MDFNIRDSSLDPHFLYHSIYNNTLIEVADYSHLELSRPTEQVSTRYSDNQQNSNLVINLMFFRLESLKHNNHSIHPDWRLISDYIPFTINISIFEEHIQTRKQTLVKNRKEEENFMKELSEAIKRLNMNNIQNIEVLEHVVQLFANDIERIWYKHLKVVNITKHSKNW